MQLQLFCDIGSLFAFEFMIFFLAGIDAGKLQLLALVDSRSKHGAFCSQISLIREKRGRDRDETSDFSETERKC